MEGPFKLATLAEVVTLPVDSRVKFFAQFLEELALGVWRVSDRGAEVAVDVTSGVGHYPAIGEWMRFVGCRTSAGVMAIFSPKPAEDFDPFLFDKCLKVRRNFEDSFQAEIVKYARPLDL
jgi:hypothetical protein